MKFRSKCMVFLVVSLFAGSAWAQNWQLVWSDEFNGSIGPDWVFETGNGSGGWGNNELQYYRRENASIENNALVITARREDFGGFRYTSARMKTQGRKTFKYGRIEARMRLPAFAGAWPAFWMLGANLPQVGWPASGEIDVMEHVNTEGRTHGTIHWRDHNGNYAQYGGSTPVNVQDWHVYAVEWDANAIRWYVDGNKFHEANIQGGVNGTEEFHGDFFLLLNFAIGGNWPGFNVDESQLPAKVHVDYVRVYSPAGGGGSGVATVYKDCNYGGYAVALPEGNYTLSQLQARGIANDDISSLRVNAGYQVTFYEHDNFGGASVTKSADTSCLVADGFNDRASSLVVSRFSQPWSLTLQAENFSAQQGVQTEPCSEGGLNVGWIDQGDWMAYNNVTFPASGNYRVEYRVASPSGGALSLDLNAGGILLGQVQVPATGGWQNWSTVSHTVNVAAGTYNLGIYAAQGGWNINWIRITRL
ncbi:carbohydrate-binding protein [Flavobacterium sp. MXW15]|uniref:Carbohydrate-binding protein n=1 Tax=Xanthomonas chitinilytica TaxID=2989819 RepID=A0ABT3JZX1_9XANT|nr:carbohydrate-binding protein [Xanthomonas sp. H13-6]MCW4456326.1 carbohydrate-binding protein [Flavobacterium sp. MXW15]MCW4474032.1 carbohydrate-binding protein [Xanthomonas sp. H13-6]